MPKTIEDVIAELQATVDRGEAGIRRYRKLIDDEQAKITDAATTLRTLQAMGVKASAPESKAAPLAAPANMTVPDMIFSILRQNPGRGFEPAGMISEITRTLGLSPDPNNVRPTMWRMKNDGRLIQDKQGRYHLPKEKPVDDKPSTGPSTGLSESRTQGREAGPGGGT